MIRLDEMRYPSFWQYQAGGWGVLVLLMFLAILPYIHETHEWRRPILYVACCFLASLSLRRVCRFLRSQSLSLVSLLTVTAGLSLVVGTATALLTEIVISRFRAPALTAWLKGTALDSVLLFIWCSLNFVINYRIRFEVENDRSLRANLREARLCALRYQLSPHFLFNSLNAVSTLVLEGNAAAATRMLAQIAGFLRATLDDEIEPEVPLSQEIGLMQSYLAIEQTRLGERLHVETAVSPDTLDALVPSLLLQPLVENAVRHGIAPRLEGGAITIRSDVRNSHLCIAVRNTGSREYRLQWQTPNHTGGIGLTNITERLKTLYGADHKFAVEWPIAGGCNVIVEVPFKRCEFEH